MPYLLRKIRRNKWYREPWLDEGDLQADALADLRTTGNKLSVWFVNDDYSNLDRIAAALAAASDHVSNLDYALIDFDVFPELGIRVEQSDGETPDKIASRKWHHDLVELTASNLMELATVIQSHDDRRSRLTSDKILDVLCTSIELDYFDLGDLKESVASKVKGHLS